MRRLLIASLLAAAFAAQADTTPVGHSYSPPDTFSASSGAALLSFNAPEGDASVILVELAAARDAADAVAQAWAQASPGFKRTLRLATPRPARNGWVDQQVFDYETSADEKLAVQAVARRASTGDGKAWVVVLLQGSEATLQKRSAPIGKFLSSLRPQGYARETFEGKTAHALTPERVAALRAWVEDAMKQLDIPGVGLSFIDQRQVVWAGGIGVRERGRPTPVDADTLFMAGSNTKAMSTALLAQAVDAGKLRWDQIASQAYPAFRLGDPELTQRIQVRHLVCACTGMPRQDLDWLFATGPKDPARKTFDQLAGMQPTSKFGEVFQYSNLMVSAAGYIAAAALSPKLELGAAYDQAMRERLFKPLGMTRTTFDLDAALKSNHASPHGDGWAGSGQPARIDVDRTIFPVRPAGAVWTTAREFSRWVQMELNHGRSPEGRVLISEGNWAERYRPQIATGEDRHYAMGLMIDRQSGVTVAKHGGATIGYISQMLWLPDVGAGFTLLTNADAGQALIGALERKFLEVLYDGRPEADALLRTAAANWQSNLAAWKKELTLPVPEDTQLRLAARYRHPVLGGLRVERAKGQLVFHFDHWSSEVALRRASDGRLSFVTIAPATTDFSFLLDDQTPEPALVLRDAQHEYRFVAVKPR
ncbi:MAG: class A beta-lactamase-related serine hydrolase [Burkholderiales bacterium]|nr:MAG: class A beta-lactamase-related serine hydrolase [Burkholderiales bacterium]